MKERKNGLFSVMSRIEGMSNQFTKTDWKIVQYMKENMQEFVSCSAEEQTLELRFPLNEWMLNPMGTMHGGIIATTVDLTMGSLTRFYRHTGTISTVTLGLSYMRPVRARGSVTVQARMEKLGRSVAFLNARVFDADGRLCVTATASFM